MGAGADPLAHKFGYGKVGVIGAIARKGNVVARVIGAQDAPYSSGLCREGCQRPSDARCDRRESRFKLLCAGMPYETVHHGKGEYVRGEVHTNNIESFWSLVKGAWWVLSIRFPRIICPCT